MEENREAKVLSSFLSYAVRKNEDPNLLAENLLKMYGSIGTLLHSSKKQMTAMGISERVASLLSSVLPFLSYSITHQKNKKYSDMSEVASFFAAKYMYLQNEVALCSLFDSKNRMIDTLIMDSGTSGETFFSGARITECAVAQNAKYIIIAHNHPSGSPEPSDTDISSTLNLMKTCEYAGVSLVEHLIIAKDRFTPIIKKYLPGRVICPLAYTNSKTDLKKCLSEKEK